MNRLLNICALMTGIFSAVQGVAFTQPVQDSAVLNSPLYREHLLLFTDRNLYAAGEPILFRVFNASNSLLKENYWSTVLYLELINTSNEPVAQGKYRLRPEGASGDLFIPDTVSSGPFCLRAYTRWMRNFPATDYCRLPLSVINPDKISGPAFEVAAQAVTVTGDSGERKNIIQCTSDKTVYGKREKVIVQVRQDGHDSSANGYYVSVCKKGYLDTSCIIIPSGMNEGSTATGSISYYPETNGISFSGRLLGGPERQPLAYTGIYLTLLGENPDCLGFITDNEGKMHLLLPYHTGSRDVLITPDPEKAEGIEILMDNEFSQDYTGCCFPGVDVFRDRRDLAEEIMLNSQVRQAFASAIQDSTPPAERNPGHYFYGTPDVRYRTGDYIALPNLQEFFYELIPMVYLRTVKKKKYFFIIGEYLDLSRYRPLILLDFVPVWNAEDILGVSPSRIDYIDIINRRYIRGDNIYGGIISIVSREGDRAGVELPSTATFYSFSTLYESREAPFPEYAGESGGIKIPDLRTTLYWLPDFDIPESGNGMIEFYTSDITGDYTVTIGGVAPDGKLVGGDCEFSVK